MTEPASIEAIVVRSQWATTIGALCDKFGGDVQTGPFGSQLHASDYSEDGIPVVMPQDMQDGRILVPVPPISRQRDFDRNITAVDKLRTAQRETLAKMDALLASLQHRAFRGEL